MQDKQQVLTLVFVLIVGLLGGYMIAQHTDAEHHEREGEINGMGDPKATPSVGEMIVPESGAQGSAEVYVQ